MVAPLLGIDDTLRALIECVCVQLEAVGAPPCLCGTTVGPPVVMQCCECGDGASGELWGQFQRLIRAGGPTYEAQRPTQPCAQVEWAAEYQLTLARCFPTIDERGDAPEPAALASAAREAATDVAAITRALHCCASTRPPYVVTLGVTYPPEGGCSWLQVTVRVPVAIGATANRATAE